MLTMDYVEPFTNRFKSSMRAWGLAVSANCECGAPEQTADHIINDCRMFRSPTDERGLIEVDSATKTWLLETELQI